MDSHNSKMLLLVIGFIYLIVMPISPEARVLFQDDFNSGNASPQWVSKICCQWVSSGWYYTQGQYDSDSMSLVHDNDPEWTDYTLSITADFVPIDNPQRNTYLGIVVRTQNYSYGNGICEGKGYVIDFYGEGWGTPNGNTIHFSRNDCTTHTGAELISKPYQMPLGTILNIIVKVQGGNFVLTVNGDNVFDYTDANPLTIYGGVGIHGIWSIPARYDNVVVQTAYLTPIVFASPLSPSSIQLAWNGDTSAKAVRIQRKAGNCSSTSPWSTRVDVKATTTSFTESGLSPSTAYSYRVRSYYGGQIFSDYSICASATTGIAGTPNMPSAMGWPFPDKTSALSRSSNEVFLAWDDESTDETRFDIYRKVNSGSLQKIDFVDANIQSYADADAIGNTDTNRYSYDVRACNQIGCSRASPTPVAVPFAPTGLAASIAGSKVHLVWTDKSNNETQLQVFRKIGTCASAYPITQIANLAANTKAYDDGDGISTTNYAYTVRAVNVTTPLPSSVGYSSWSNCVSAKAP
jgi:hypothetical protein